MTENQKLREALQAISDIDDSTNHAVDASAALDRIGQIARQALALPTAAPAVERELFERTMVDKFDWERKDFKTDARDFYIDGHTVTAFVGWRARAALSAGDAVDARQRAVHSSISRALQEAGIRNEVLVGMCIEVGLETYDAAMRKGQL